MDWDGPAAQVERYFKQNPGRAELHLMGSPPATAPRPLCPPARLTGWVGDVESYYRAIDWHVALAPLRPAIFNRSKSALRLLEAAALGLPVVASAAGPYADWLRHGETGYLARQDHEWVRYLRILVNDDAVRLELGANARKQASEWTVEERAADWEAAYAAQLAGVGVR
jgi:glycosyltransferase involved in cell wall biosynthesis